MTDEGDDHPFKVWINQQHESAPGLLRTDKVEIKLGQRVYKAASLLTYGDEWTGEVSREELVVASYKRKADGPGFEFTSPAARWTCENEEISRLKELLNRNFPVSGPYVLAGSSSAAESLVEDIEEGRVDQSVISKLARALMAMPGAAEALAGLDEAALLASVIDRVRQRSVVERLRDAVEDPRTTEPQIQAIIQDEPWLFGSRYIRTAERRSFVIGDQLDVPLIRSDGALHVVEIKRANIPRLVVEHRHDYIVGTEVNEAVGQALNYLRNLDEERDRIKNRLGVDTRRASATVIIGHPAFVQGVDEEAVVEAIRTYNSHLARIEVITYADLVDGAERSLALSGDPIDESDEPDDSDDWGSSYDWSTEAPF